MKPKPYKRVSAYLLHPLVFFLAVVLVSEEWLWDTLKAQLHRFSGLPLVAALESRIKRLSPIPSLLLMVLPGVVLIPFKAAALYWMAHHHPVLGICALIMAKVTGTAVAAYVFDLVRTNARKLHWFDTFYVAVIGTLTRAKQWLQLQPAYQRMQTLLHKWRAVLLTVPKHRFWLVRKFLAAKALAKRPRDHR